MAASAGKTLSQSVNLIYSCMTSINETMKSK